MEADGLQLKEEDKLNALKLEKEKLQLEKKQTKPGQENGAQGNKKQEEIKNIIAPTALATAEQFREALKTHTEIARAERAANGGKIPEFIPANRGFGGWKARKKDEIALWWKRKNGGAPTLDLYSYRIAEKLDTLEGEELRQKEEREKNHQPEPAPASMGAVIQDALSWKLSWSMIDPRYFYHNAEKVQSMFRNARRLKYSLDSGDESLKDIPKEKQKVLNAIVNAVSILYIAFENNMLSHGVSIRGKAGEKLLRREKTSKPTMKECRAYFRQSMRELHNLEQKANLSIHELAEANETELKSQSNVAKDQLPALLASQNTQYINSGNKRFVDGLVVSLKNYRNEPPERVAKIYKNLSAMIKTAPKEEEKKAFCQEVENIFRDILTWDMNEFEYHGTSDLAHPDYLRKRQKLYLVFELDNAFKYYKKIRDNQKTKESLCSISDALYQEASARMYTLQALHSFHDIAERLTALNTDKSVEEWYEMSSDQISTLASSYKGENEKQFRDVVMSLGVMKFAGESGSNILYHPGKTSVNALLKKNREDTGVPDNLDQFIKEDAKKNEQEALAIKDEKEFRKHISERVLLRLRTMDPTNLSELVSTWKYYSQELSGNMQLAKQHGFSEEQANWFASEIYNTVSDYLESYMGRDLINSMCDHIAELNAPLLVVFREVMKESVPEDFHEPLVQREKETDQSFADRKEAQRAQYYALKLKNTEVVQKVLVSQQLPDMFIHDRFPQALSDGYQVQYSATETVGDMMTEKLQNWANENIKDQKERELFRAVSVMLPFSNTSGFPMIKKEKSEEFFREINQKNAEKVESFLTDFFR